MLQFFRSDVQVEKNSKIRNWQKKILKDERLDIVLGMAQETLKPKDGRFKAGSNYAETWIRDFATFIEIALNDESKETIKERLLLFLDFQGEDGNIVDGYVELATNAGYDYIYSKTAPTYKAHKNTVETDQETSFILAIARYIEVTGDSQILTKVKNGKTVIERCDMALDFLKKKMYSEKYGLLYGATTIDWTDVQPETDWGVFTTADTHWCIDVYDNAMYVLAIDEYLKWIKEDKVKLHYWKNEKTAIAANVRKYLWDEKNQKFIPHVYLKDSPFQGFNEDEIYYFGGTVSAILAGILNEEAMIKTGHLELAYQEIQPFLERVIKNKGFYEWYSVIDHQPHGSNSFLGAAGALGKAVLLMKNEASGILDEAEKK